MQDQLYGLPKRGAEPDSWTPRIIQNAGGTFNLKDAIPLRKPNTAGLVQTMGQFVVAQASVVLDAAGAASAAIYLELPLQSVITVRSLQGGAASAAAASDLIAVGTFYLERAASVMWTGAIQAYHNTNQAIFRTGAGAGATAMGSAPAFTLAAGDVFQFNLAYFANV